MGNGQRSVRFWRLQAGLTLEEVALRAFVARATVLRLERGERSSRALEASVASALGVSSETIAWGAVEDSGEGSVSLLALREDAGLSERQVAGSAGVTLRTLRRAEAGALIHPRYAKALADFWKVCVTDFYPRERRRAA